MEIQCTLTLESADSDFLTQKINAETPEFGAAFSFTFFMRDEKNQILE